MQRTLVAFGHRKTTGPLLAGPLLAGLSAAGLVVSASGPARADVSSWISTAAGPALAADDSGEEWVPQLRIDAGMGSPPSGAWMVGGGLQLGALFGFGTDLGAAVRLASGSYVRGDWGLALDLGGYHRFSHLSNGASGALTLGLPWGLLLALNGSVGTENSRTLGLVLGLDFARLTAHRTSGAKWWPNPLAERGTTAGAAGFQPASAMSFR